MILEIIKWYSIIHLSTLCLASLWKCIKDRDLSGFVAFLLLIPTIVYLIIKWNYLLIMNHQTGMNILT